MSRIRRNQPRHHAPATSDDNLVPRLDPVEQRSELVFRLEGTDFVLGGGGHVCSVFLDKLDCKLVTRFAGSWEDATLPTDRRRGDALLLGNLVKCVRD